MMRAAEWQAEYSLLCSVCVKATHEKMRLSPECSAGEENKTTQLCAQLQYSLVLLCSSRNRLNPEGSYTLVQRVNPINKHERMGLARLLIKSTLWGGKLFSVHVCRYQ